MIQLKGIIEIGSKRLKPIHFIAHAGETWGVLGPNGCGKSTFLHALAGLHPLKSGEFSLAALSSKERAKERGILFQVNEIPFSQTVWEYCLAARFPHQPYFKKATEQDKKITFAALAAMELADFQHRALGKLSGGEKRRVEISSLLAQTPRIYLLDEPVNHLDLRHQIKTLLHFHKLAIKEKKIVIMSLHDVNLAQQFCHHLLLLFADGTHLSGPTKEVLTAENLHRLYQHPLKAIATNDGIVWHASK